MLIKLKPMYIYFLFTTIFMTISMIIYFLPQLLSHLLSEGNSPLEAGFSSVSETSSSSFSIQFFLLMIIFVIFDLEIIILFGALLQKSIILILFFMGFIIFTLWLEWGTKKLKWAA